MKGSLKRAAVISLVAVQTCLLGWFIFSPGPRSSWLPYRRTLQSTAAEYDSEFTTEHIRLEDGHFVENGERYRLILRYSVCSGLINQHYSHMSAFILAKALRAEVSNRCLISAGVVKLPPCRVFFKSAVAAPIGSLGVVHGAGGGV